MTINKKWLGTDSYLDSVAKAARKHKTPAPIMDSIVDFLDDPEHDNNMDVDSDAFVAELKLIQKNASNKISQCAIDTLTSDDAAES